MSLNGIYFYKYIMAPKKIIQNQMATAIETVWKNEPIITAAK